MILTGAPIELLDFEAVDYWEEIAHLLDGLRARKTPLFTLCWAAQAALYRYRGLPKHTLTEKRFGVFEHRIAAPGSAAVAGLEGPVAMPVSRHTETRRETWGGPARASTCCSTMTRPMSARWRSRRSAMSMRSTISNMRRGRSTTNTGATSAAATTYRCRGAYYPDDDPAQPPGDRWRAAGERFYANWVAMLAR